MSIKEAKLDELLARIGYQRGTSIGNSNEVWVVYYSRAIQAPNQCLIGTASEISMLSDEAVSHLIENKTNEIDQKIVAGTQPL
ncbi:MAG: hypothetical protein ABI406_10880 [Ktedonobacteraceae bacterium]